MPFLLNFFHLLIFSILFSLSLQQPLPNTYTQQSPIQISPNIQDRSDFSFSSNQTSVAWFYVYNTYFTYLPSIYYPNNQKKINFPYSIVDMDFSPMSDALFIASYQFNAVTNSTIYHFAKYDVYEGFLSQPMVLYGNVTMQNFSPFANTKMRVVSNYSDFMDGRLAFVADQYLLDITLRGPLEPKVRKFNLSTYCKPKFNMKDMEYMQLSKNSDNYILYMIGQCFLKYDSKQGLIILVNTQWPMNDGISILMKGELVLISSLINTVTHLYQTKNNSLPVFIDSMQNYTIHSGTSPQDQNFFVAKNYSSSTQSTAIKVINVLRNDEYFLNENLKSNHHRINGFYYQESPFTLKVTFDKYFSKSKLMKMTRNANDIYLINTTDLDNKTTIIHRWSLCVDGQYQSNNQCLSCSPNCKTCTSKADLCTSCTEDKIYKYGSCGTCQTQFLNCLQCNQTECLKCNQKANFYLDPISYKCTCKNGSYYVKKSQKCQFCSDEIVGCLNCTDAKNCLKCDQNNNFIKNDTSGKCVCPEKYSLKNNKTCQLCQNYIKNCIQCTWQNQQTYCKKCINDFYPSQDNKSCVNCDRNIPGCLKCSGDQCTQCDSSLFFNTTVVNGSCICQNGYGEQRESCIPCKEKGCFSCVEPENCKLCLVNKNFNPNPVNGSCNCKNNTFINEDKTQCFYCNQKILGCLNCSTLSICTQCDSASNFALNKQRSGCSCMQNYTLVGSVCKLCSSIIQNCQKCMYSQGQTKCQQCLQTFVLDLQSNLCKCPNGFRLNNENICEKENQKQDKNYLTQILIGGGSLLVVLGIISIIVLKKCKKRRLQLTQEQDQQNFNNSQVENTPSIIKSRNQTIISGTSQISL